MPITTEQAILQLQVLLDTRILEDAQPIKNAIELAIKIMQASLVDIVARRP